MVHGGFCIFRTVCTLNNFAQAIIAYSMGLSPSSPLLPLLAPCVILQGVGETPRTDLGVQEGERENIYLH